ncbi:hypothetical protein FQV39_05255 [Bosea sp. F3-2]|uniref:hypothetical protein n=1 Tax=Bosea sp. F3-2 TaxID=2599640 RepID=UPI0011EFCEEE|nr:hypothetical protein [Bosea sp. F3-2]QEL22042.1 hypothetical protein FQV39_05255 [Bosea sp. F3-2]
MQATNPDHLVGIGERNGMAYLDSVTAQGFPITEDREERTRHLHAVCGRHHIFRLSTAQPAFQGPLPAAGRFSSDIFVPAVTSAFKGNGFTIHPEKTHYADRNSRRIVTGVKINAGLNVDRRYVRNIWAILHSIQSIGLAAAQKKHDDGGGKGNLEAHLRGKISYIAHLKGALSSHAKVLRWP